MSPTFGRTGIAWTRLTVIMSCVALVVLIPLILWAAQRYGGPGAASSWLVYNAGVGILSIGIIHRGSCGARPGAGTLATSPCRSSRWWSLPASDAF